MRRRIVIGIATLVLAAAWAVLPARAQRPALTTDTEVTEMDIGEPVTETDREKADLDLRRTLPTVVQEGAVDPDAYILGPGDLLQLDLWGRVLRAVPLEVSPEGRVFLPGSGPIDVSGKSLSWARKMIKDRVVALFRGVNADVRLVRLRTFKVFVTGFVGSPGPVEVTSTTRASEAVRQARPLEEASRRRIDVRRRDGQHLPLDMRLAETAGDMSRDPLLVDGDVVHVPRATEFIEAAGALGRSTMFEFAPGDSLSTLLRLSGGTLAAAVRDRALLVRFRSASERESLWVDLDAVARGEGDVPLRDGDRLFVQHVAEYHVLHRVGIMGEVNQPGSYPIVVGTSRFSDLITWAGGFRPLANRSAILLLRESGPTTERDPEFDRLVRLARTEMTESEYAKFQTKLAERKNTFRVDYARLERGSEAVDPLLQPGDFVRVEQLVPSVRIEGEVRRPGFVDYEPGRSLHEYVQLAGGYTDRALRRGVRVSRSLTGQVIPARSLRTVQPGDFVWVPERKDVDAWQVFRDVVTVAGQVAVIIFTLSR